MFGGTGAKKVVKIAVLVVLCLLLAVAVWAMDRYSLSVQPMVDVFSYGFYANALPFVVVFLLLLALSNRLSFALLLTVFLAVALYGANYLKLKYLLQPVLFSDIFVLREFHLSTLELLNNYAHPVWLVSAVVLLLLVVLATFRYDRDFFRRRSLARWGVLVVSLLACVCVAAGPAWLGDVYSSRRLRVVPWSPVRTVLHAGLAGAILYNDVEYANALREPASTEAIEAFLKLKSPAAAPVAAPPATAQPDIVIVQSESFFDPEILKDIDGSATLLPNLHRAMAQGLVGAMKAPTFGGGTLRTEFEVLTGVPMRAYPKISFPYLQINRKRIPSLVQVMHQAGYAAYAVHPNDGNFWDRNKAFKAMGFDHFFSLRDFPANARRDGWYLADSALTDEVESLLSKAARPTFIMAISIEGHGPYEHVPVADKAAWERIPVPAGWSPKATKEYRNYVYHIGDADHELGRLWDFLKARGRPFVLVFYGDHLPGLQYVYEAAHGFDNGNPATSQRVPWVMIGGNGARPPQERKIYSWMMGSEVLDAAGIQPPPYYTMLDRADRLLDAPGGVALDATVQDGIDSLARLYLNGRPLPKLPSDAQANTAVVAHATPKEMNQ
jgi:phosphoglycerol transferase MdoB-like AlkP superfamily enzyme